MENRGNHGQNRRGHHRGGSYCSGSGRGGNIRVRPGDHLPLTPVNRASLQIEYAVKRRWALGADLRYAEREFLVGDESNQEPTLPSTWVVDLHGSWYLRPSLRFFANIENLFDRTNYAYGTFTQLDRLPPNIQLTDTRAFSPSPGRTFHLGLHLAL